MIRPPFAARVVTGLIVTAIEETRKLPTTAVTLPMTAVSQTLQAGMRFQQGIAELAIKGDEALDAIFHRAQEEPEWATFDDDLSDDIGDVTHDPRSQSAATVTPITSAPTATAAPGHLPTAPDEPTPADMPPAQADTVEPTPTTATATPAAKKAPAKKAAATKAAAKKATATKAPAKKAPAKKAAEDTTSPEDRSVPSGSGRFALYSSAPENVVRSDVEAAPVAPAADAPEIVEFLDYDGLTLAQLRAKIRSVGIDDLRALADYERSHRKRAPFQTMLDNRITAAAGK